MRVLVTYATKHGATAEIAEKISEVLAENGLAVDVMEIKKVDNLTPYEAIVVGSSIYFSDWHKDMVNFLKENEELLIKREVWIFSSGPTGHRDTYEILAEWRFPNWFSPLLERIKPNDGKVFFGNLDYKKLNFFERRLAKMLKAPIGDFRDWEKIESWAQKIAVQLKVVFAEG